MFTLFQKIPKFLNEVPLHLESFQIWWGGGGLAKTICQILPKFSNSSRALKNTFLDEFAIHQNILSLCEGVDQALWGPRLEGLWTFHTPPQKRSSEGVYSRSNLKGRGEAVCQSPADSVKRSYRTWAKLLLVETRGSRKVLLLVAGAQGRARGQVLVTLPFREEDRQPWGTGEEEGATWEGPGNSSSNGVKGSITWLLFAGFLGLDTE